MGVLNYIRKIACLKRCVCLSVVALLMHSSIVSAENTQIENSQQVHPTPIWIQDPWSGDSVLTAIRPPDQSLWNAKRIEDYEASLKIDTAPPLGILTIEKLNIQVPIYNGTSDFILDRGAGRIKGMAKMNEDDNLGISGHRDGFFRALKDIQLDDDILIQTTRGVEKYAVSNVNIVPKSDVSVLSKTDEKTLTIVTCYPFYYVGHAPKRFIVTAIPRPDDILDQAE